MLPTPRRLMNEWLYCNSAPRQYYSRFVIRLSVEFAEKRKKMSFFKNLFRKNKKESLNSVQEKPESLEISLLSSSSQPQLTSVNKFDADIIPQKLQDTPIAYRYHDVKITSQNPEVYRCILNTGNLTLNAVSNQGEFVLQYQDQYYCKINNPKIYNMLSDWINNNEPYLIYANTPDTVYIVFYRDKRKKLSGRECSIVKLTAYSSTSKQDVISFLEPTEELILCEDYDSNGNDIVIVEGEGEEIGRLPKKTANKYLEEGAAGCFFHHDEYDDEKDKYIPYVEIYW